MMYNTSVSHFYKRKSNNDTRGTFICYHLLSATGLCSIHSRALTNVSDEDFVAPPLSITVNLINSIQPLVQAFSQTFARVSLVLFNGI